jgi:uncharacterized repeat protein (TIGR01451 family)
VSLSFKLYTNKNTPAFAGGVFVRAISKTSALTKKLARGTFTNGMLFGALILSSYANQSMAATPFNYTVNNIVVVNYSARGNTLQASDNISFITARESSGAGTPAIITLMQNGIDFSSQLQAARSTQTGTGNTGLSNSNSSMTTGSSQDSRSFDSRSFSNATSRTTASSNGASLSGAFTIGPGQCATNTSGATLVAQPTPLDYQGNTLSVPSTLSLASDDYFKVGDTIFIHLQDLDQNQDPTQVEKIIVSILSDNGNDQETIQLTETAVSSGTFTGYVQSVDVNDVGATSFNCQLSVTNDSSIQASYQDQFDARDLVKAGALFDPNSYVVNADTGEYINGIEVTLIDANTGQAADVLSNKGGVFPNPIITGSTVQDSKGNSYTFPYGGFSFPVLANGNYRVQIAESAYLEYPIDSSKSLDEVNALPSGPFNLDEQGSRALAFTSGITFRLDIPLDPKDNNVLLTKTSNKSSASIGDLIRYSINLDNSEIPGTNVKLKDQLPQGFRYIPGSATIDGITIADPSIENNGRGLTFTLNNIAVEESFSIKYVARISVNTPIGTATNSAWIEDEEDIIGEGLLVSNVATTDTEIIEELFSDKARLFGRVYVGDCQGNTQQEGISGVRIYLENGTYVVTDEDGMWHIEGQNPGTHVVQLDTDTLPKYLDLVACDNLGVHAGRSYSQFVDVAKGSMWRSDFVVKLKPPSVGEVTQRLSSQVLQLTEQEAKIIDSPVEQKIKYNLKLTGTEVILKDLRAMIMLPNGVRYKENSVTLDGSPLAEPKKYDEQTLLFSLNDPGKDWSHQLEFEGWITKDAKPGEMVTRSVAMFNAPSENNQRTPVALTSALLAIVPSDKRTHKPEEAPKFSSFNPELNDADKRALIPILNTLQGLTDLKLEVTGHTDSVPIASRSRHIFENNTQLSLARARSTANYLAAQLGLNPDQVTIAGQGSRNPIARNSSTEDRAKNRRVEVNILAGNNGMSIARADSGDQLIATLGVAPGGFDFPIEATASGPIRNTVTMPEFDTAYLAQTDSTFKWLWPSEGYLPNIPSTKVAIKHKAGQRIQLKLNQTPVSQLNFSGQEKYTANNSAISKWAGVDLKEGNNVFEASLLDDEGNIIDRKVFELHYAGTPTKVKLLKDETKAVADGVIAPVIAVQLFDKDGYTVRDGLQGEFTVDGPYSALDPNKNQSQINRNDFKPNYEISADGIAYITLEPTTQAGEAVLRFPLANGQEEEIRVWLKPQNREWMLIALGEGTIGYQDISGNIESAKGQGEEDGVYTDGRLALFAKGQIAGDWLLTAAYDSAKGKTTPFEKLLDPNKYYTLYGDNSQQKLDASMEGKLYLRVEKERFYTVFGDYNTDLNNTELSTYLRKFHGIQSVFQGDIVSFSAFATESAESFVREEIRGDGTSGLYSLSKQDILIQSETISIQVRDRFRSELILSEIELSKDTDYSIDYIDGTIFFKAPIQSTDESLNPRFIIARYETQSAENNDLTYGGRAAVHVLDKRLEVGTTLINEELGTNSKTLSSVDLRLQLSDALEITAETAVTDNLDNGVNTLATANYVSLDYRGEQLQAKAYVRTEEAGFGLNQLNDSEGSTEKASIEATYYVTSQQYVNALFTDQNTLGSELRQTMTEVKFNNEYELGRYHLGARQQDTSSVGGDTRSVQQLLAGHSYTLMNGKLLLNADAEINIKQTEDVYDLVRLSSDYRINETVTLFGIFETGFGSEAPQRSVFGLRAKPWQGMQISNSVEQQQSKDGSRLFAVHGLNQEINLDEHWQVSFGFDQAENLANSINDQANLEATSEDFYAVSTGWGYRSPTWQWTNRLEYRESELARKWNGITGLYRPIGLGLAMGINGEYRLDNGATTNTEFSQIEFNIGLRPLEMGLAWLNQTKLITEEQSSANDSIISNRLINNTHLNMRWTDTQLSMQYGLKWVDETIDAIDYSGVIDLIGAQFRHNITQRWDWGIQGQRLYDYELDDSRYSYGISIGLTPAANTWVSLGYNLLGFNDSDFNEAGYSGQGIYLKIRVKADQDNLKSLKSYFK